MSNDYCVCQQLYGHKFIPDDGAYTFEPGDFDFSSDDSEFNFTGLDTAVESTVSTTLWAEHVQFYTAYVRTEFKQ